MTRFSIDYINEDSFFNKLDYSNKVILNSITDPLFVYDKKKNKYICNSCKNYYINDLIINIELRDDLYYHDGTKVNVNDYVESINNGKSLLCELSNIKSVFALDNTIIIKLYKKDRNIINKLSCYFLSPKSGKYYIDKNSGDKLVLKPNKYYRSKAIENLEFIKIDNYKNDILLFNNKKIDINNNTFFSLDNLNKNNEKSGIIISLEVSTKFNVTERKLLINSIDKKKLIDNLGNAFFVKNDYFFNYNTDYKYNKLINKKIKKIKLAYNEFYPNYIIASLIKDDLKNNNYDVDLVELKYDDFKSIKSYDLRLTLNYFEYIDDLYFYNSNYFKYIMKNNFFYNYFITKRIMFNFINKSFKKKYIKEPLLSYYSNYDTNAKTHDFSYLECDYKKI